MKKYIKPSVKVRVINMAAEMLSASNPSNTNSIPMYKNQAITSDDKDYTEAAKSNNFSVWGNEE